jgi:secretion/DNA translocation related TadE-like protein
MGEARCSEEQARDRENRAGARSVTDMGEARCSEEQARDRENRAGARSVTDTERGSVVVLVCGLIALAVALILAVVALGGAVVLAGRAEAAADGAALAAADSVALGHPSIACGAASLIAELDRAHLVECHVDPEAVEVVVALTGAGGAELGRTVQARARAEVDLRGSRGGAGG